MTGAFVGVDVTVTFVGAGVTGVLVGSFVIYLKWCSGQVSDLGVTL
jgi:hypothetical protein